MEEQTPWLVGRIGKKCWLLVKDDNAYYLIEVGKNLDWETEEWLMRQGVSEALLKELNLAFTYIPKKDIRGVAFSGTEAGDCVYLYLRSEKRKLTLELDYDREWMEAFFEKLPRFAAPKKKEPGDKGWRKERQDKALFHKLRFVAPAFLILGAGSSIGYVMTAHWAFYTVVLLCIAAQLGLAICMPVYFTIYLPKGAKKQNVWNLDTPLIVMMLILCFRMRFNWMSYDALWWILPLGALAGALIYWRVKDLHQDEWALLSSLLMGMIAAVFLAAQINEVYDFTPPETYILEVEDLHSSGGKRRSYYCTVTLPDGRETDASISWSLYQELREGDSVQVIHDAGALGIEYIRVVSEE